MELTFWCASLFPEFLFLRESASRRNVKAGNKLRIPKRPHLTLHRQVGAQSPLRPRYSKKKFINKTAYNLGTSSINFGDVE